MYTTKWTVKSLNLILGQIGGYTALLWMVITFCMTGYENHKFRSSLISSIYVSTAQGPAISPSTDKSDSSQVLKSTLAAPAKFNYSYFEAFMTWLVTLFCSCCCAERQWY